MWAWRVTKAAGNFYAAKKDHLLNAKVARSEKASFLARYFPQPSLRLHSLPLSTYSSRAKGLGRFMKEPVEGSVPMTLAEIKLECSIAMYRPPFPLLPSSEY